MNTGTARVMRAAAHGAYVAMTGDLTRLRELRQQVESRSLVEEAWKDVGQSLTTAMEHERPGRR